jgi:hypothetical protein
MSKAETQRRVGVWARRLEAVLGVWRRVDAPMVEIEADLESAALDLPIGRATDVVLGAQRRVGQKARSRARHVAARGRSDGAVGGGRSSPDHKICTL